MPVTRKKLAAQKKEKVEVKEENPNRLHMSKADAVKDNARIKEEKEAVAKLKRDLKDKNTKGGGDFVPGPGSEDKDDVELSEDQQKRIGAISAKIADTKGPGSKAKKEKLLEEIETIKVEVNEE